MKIYLTPKDLEGHVLGDVVLCSSRKEVELTIARFKALGYPGIDQVRGDIVCDFCSFPMVKFCYQVSPGDVYVQIEDEAHIDADGKWGSCEVCHDLISAGDWDEMTKRSTIALFEQAGVTDPSQFELMLTAASVQAIHGHFRAMWDGTPPAKVISDVEFLRDAGINPEA